MRCARAHEDSCALIEQHLAIDEDVRATLAAVRRERHRRARGASFAFGQVDEQNRASSG